MRISIILVGLLVATPAFAGQTSAQMKVGITIVGTAPPVAKSRRTAAPAGGSGTVTPIRSVTQQGRARIEVLYY